jgi:hypothetical protein
LALRSKRPEAEALQDWVVEEVLPQIRALASYSSRRPQTRLQLQLINEADLHYKVVDFIRTFHPEAILVAGLGENQDTPEKRIDSFKKGYTRGQCDLLLLNRHAKYSGLALELKTPACNGVTSPDQRAFLQKMAGAGYRTLLSNNYDEICNEIRDYFRNIRVMCQCGKWLRPDHVNRHSISLCQVNGPPAVAGEDPAHQSQ